MFDKRGEEGKNEVRIKAKYDIRAHFDSIRDIHYV